jgi:phosphatidate cytidylyltransferase
VRLPPLVSRLLVAAVGLPLVLGVVWLGGWWLFVLVAIAAVLALHEFYGMARPLRPLVPAGYLGALLALLGLRLGGVEWMVAGFLATFALAFLLKGLADTRATATASVSATVMGVGWIALGLGHLMLIRDLEPHGRLDAFAVLIAIWANDTLAYVAGRALGRHKLAPRTSPGKTWEGFVGGTVATLFVTFVAFYEEQDYLPIWQALVLGGVVAVAGPIGDLFESALKRDMQVKDSGRLLGGHGGMLDRIDAPLFASVAAFYTLLAFGA